ncbi:CysO-cysteine peptidase [bacterium HR15]|nr:CysO-cysteine peptidase [bacterium HR15]
MALRLSAQAEHEIRAHARAEYPYECCGALLGTETGGHRTVEYVLRLANERMDERERRFFISPQQVLMAERRAHREGLLLLGFYHSHPDHPAIPSEYDRRHALPWYSYVIVSVPKGEPSELRSWRLRDDRSAFDEEPVERLIR